VLKKAEPMLNREQPNQKAFQDALKGRLGEEANAAHAAAFLGSAEPVAPQLTAATAPLMQSIVPLIFLLFILPAIVYGYVAGTVKSHRDIIQGMSKTMSTMGYYIVLAFFASLFIAAFGQSNIGALLALKGAGALKALALPGQVTIVGIILLTALVNLLIGSASAKWALLAPIFVPMLMQLGISPELSQAAYRVGDSTTNIITPLMPYFPLVVVFGQRYVKNTGIGTLVSLMLPYSVVFLITWTLFLLTYWMLGIPLGLQAPYGYP
jgi:aminobenzoyl-glutamate transport protein